MEEELRKCACGCGKQFYTKNPNRDWYSWKCRRMIDPTFNWKKERRKQEGKGLTIQYPVDNPSSAIFTD